MCRANRGDARRRRRRREPVAQRCANDTAQRRVDATGTGPGWLSRDDEDQPLAGDHRVRDCGDDPRMRPVEAKAVEIDDAVGDDATRFQPPVPAAVERMPRYRASPGWRASRSWRWCRHWYSRRRRTRRACVPHDVGGHPPPERGFVRAEGARHRSTASQAASPYRAGRGSALRRGPTCPPRCAGRRRRHPRTYRRGSRP